MSSCRPLVKKNPSKQIFLTKAGWKKGVFPHPKIGAGKWAFNLDSQQWHLVKL